MDCVTAREFTLPLSHREFEGHIWFNFWDRELWPYRELDLGDTVYWMELPGGRIVWESTVEEIERIPYRSKQALLDRLMDKFRTSILKESSFEAPYAEPYLKNAPERGYCLAFRVKPVRQPDLAPAGLHVPAEGWLKLTNDLKQKTSL